MKITSLGEKWTQQNGQKDTSTETITTLGTPAETATKMTGIPQKTEWEKEIYS